MYHNKYLNISSGKQSNPRNFLKARFVIFKCQKYVKKEYIEMAKKIYLEAFKECARSLCFPLQMLPNVSLKPLNLTA